MNSTAPSGKRVLREAALGRPIPHRVRPHPIASEQWVELGRLAANLNQLQRAIHRGQVAGVPAPLVEELRALLRDIRRSLVAGTTSA